MALADGLYGWYKPVGYTSAEFINVLRTELTKKFGLPKTKNIKDDRSKTKGDRSKTKYDKYKTKKPKWKLGHGGTLDKQAEGLLVVGIGEGCKKLHNYLVCDKIYEVDIYFGVQTNTDDGGGFVTDKKPIDHITQELFETVCDEFIGEIMQIPPDYCAKKVNGKRVSDRIRDGEDIKPKPCSVKIYSITVNKFKLPYARITVKCGRGTYMRSLVRDIGKRLDSCAYMCALLRTQQNEFKVEDAFHLDCEKSDAVLKD